MDPLAHEPENLITRKHGVEYTCLECPVGPRGRRLERPGLRNVGRVAFGPAANAGPEDPAYAMSIT